MADVAARGKCKITTNSTFFFVLACGVRYRLTHTRGSSSRKIGRTGLRIERICGTEHRTARLDSVEALPNHADDRARSHVLDQTREERPPLQVLVVYANMKKGAL